jgi:hypothetical protein
MISEYIRYYSVYYWSLKAEYTPHSLFGGFRVPMSLDYWFYETGFYDYVLGPSLSKVFVIIFAAQLLTLITGTASVFFNRRILALAPLTFSFFVTILMIYTNVVLSKSNIAVDPYLPGYWLTYPASIMLVFSLILNIASEKRSITYTPTPTLTQ